MTTDVKFDRQSLEKAMAENAGALQGNIDHYYDWSLRAFPIEKNRRILDLGCGPGIYFKNIMKYQPQRYVGADYSRAYLKTLQTMMDRDPRCETMTVDLLDREAWRMFTGQSFDYIFCFDVIEHLENDRAALENIHRIMTVTNASMLFLKVPATPGIYGENDRVIGHYRRYSHRTLMNLIKRRPFQIHSIRYHNLPGILPWLVVGRVLKRSLAASEKESRLYNLAAPFIEAFERLVPPPIGLSLCVVCSLEKE